MLVTAAICTWNRAKLLDQTLSHFLRLSIPADVAWELLVVNNNCADETDDVLARYSASLPLRRLFEPKPGHSNARNCAVAAARGELIVWTDDDVVVFPDWLREYVNAARRHPEADFFGGTIDPWFAAEPPPWLERNLECFGGAFALRQFGEAVRPFAENEVPYGASMAFRTAVLREHGFNPELGRVGTQLVSGDDTNVILRMREAGHRGVWVGTARVQHYIPRERMTRRYLREYFEGIGRTEMRNQAAPPVCKLLWGAPRYAVRRFCESRLKEWCCFPFGGRRWARAFRASALARGMIDESRARTVRARRIPSESAQPA